MIIARKLTIVSLIAAMVAPLLLFSQSTVAQVSNEDERLLTYLNRLNSPRFKIEYLEQQIRNSSAADTSQHLPRELSSLYVRQLFDTEQSADMVASTRRKIQLLLETVS